MPANPVTLDDATVDKIASKLAEKLGPMPNTASYDDQAIWTIKMVCDYYHVGTKTVRRLITEGKLQPIRVSGRQQIQFKKNHVKRIFESGKSAIDRERDGSGTFIKNSASLEGTGGCFHRSPGGSRAGRSDGVES